VHFKAEVTSASDATYTWFFGSDEDNQPGEDSLSGDGTGNIWLPPPDASGVRVVETDHVYEPGDQPQTITVRFSTSTGPSAACVAEQTFSLEPCPGKPPGRCPVDQVKLEVADSNGIDVTGRIEEGECLAPGRYVVRVRISPPGATGDFAWRVDGFAAAIGQRDVVATDGARLTLDLTAFRSVSVIAASCASDGIDLRPCKPPCCPDLDGLSSSCMSRCPPSTIVTLTATGSDLECAEVFAWEFGDGTSAETATPVTTHSYPRLDRFKASVAIIRPRECGAPRNPRKTVVVEPCPPSCFCIFLAVASALLLLTFLSLMPLVACVADPATSSVLSVALIVVAILMGIALFWWFLDPCCRPTSCELPRIFFWVFSWALVIVGALAALGCVSAIPFGVLYVFVQQAFLQMINDRDCNPGAPSIYSWPFASCR
jgi:hypothetical protein